MLTVAKDRGLGDFTTVQDAIKVVPVINKNPVMISVKLNIYRSENSWCKIRISHLVNVNFIRDQFLEQLKE